MSKSSQQNDDPFIESGLNTSALAFNDNRLSYVGQECRRIPTELHSLYGSRTRCLDLSSNAIASLQGLNLFHHLEELVLDNNCLTDKIQLPLLPLLHTLSLNKNNLRNLELLLGQVSRCLPALKYLSLLGNPLCPDQLSDAESDDRDYVAYRMYVLHHVPGLSFLDSTSVRREERVEAQQRGQFMKVARPSSEAQSQPTPFEPALLYSPLPSSRREAGDHSGAYGKCRYRYSGKQSEGNRFIQNSDL